MWIDFFCTLKINSIKSLFHTAEYIFGSLSAPLRAFFPYRVNNDIHLCRICRSFLHGEVCANSDILGMFPVVSFLLSTSYLPIVFSYRKRISALYNVGEIAIRNFYRKLVDFVSKILNICKSHFVKAITTCADTIVHGKT